MHKLYSLILYVDNDKLAQDANAMLEKQDNKSECIRTMLADLVKANGVIEYYTDIPRKERLERFFGYSGKTENTSETGKRKGGRKCTCQFILSPYNDYPDGLEYDVLVALDIQSNTSAFLREFFMDFVRANGIIANYADISENERLERFFGYVAWTVTFAGMPNKTVKMLKDKGIEILQYYDGTRYVSSNITYTAPDGKKVHITI